MVRNITQPDQATVITAPVQLHQQALEALDHQIVQALLRRPAALALDCAEVQTVDSASLNWMLAVQNRVTLQNITFSIRNASPLLRDVFKATRLDKKLKLGDANSLELAHA
jgi:anti-anti-sigma factor